MTKVLAILLLITSANVNAATVSWYGERFHGKYTASGEVFDMNKMTCASNTHKMGTKLKVTNKSNGLSVTCKVNDTGGFKKYGRTLDLSKKAFSHIENTKQGIANVSIQVLK